MGSLRIGLSSARGHEKTERGGGVLAQASRDRVS